MVNPVWKEAEHLLKEMDLQSEMTAGIEGVHRSQVRIGSDIVFIVGEIAKLRVAIQEIVEVLDGGHK